MHFLPDEILHSIFCYCDHLPVIQYRQVCKQWQRAIECDTVWQRHVRHFQQDMSMFQLFVHFYAVPQCASDSTVQLASKIAHNLQWLFAALPAATILKYRKLLHCAKCQFVKPASFNFILPESLGSMRVDYIHESNERHVSKFLTMYWEQESAEIWEESDSNAYDSGITNQPLLVQCCNNIWHIPASDYIVLPIILEVIARIEEPNLHMEQLLAYSLAKRKKWLPSWWHGENTSYCAVQ